LGLGFERAGRLPRSSRGARAGEGGVPVAGPGGWSVAWGESDRTHKRWKDSGEHTAKALFFFRVSSICLAVSCDSAFNDLSSVA
jgi:hypothetical protein